MFKDVLKGTGKGAKASKGTLKWKVWGDKEINKMKKEGSVSQMMKMPKKKVW